MAVYDVLTAHPNLARNSDVLFLPVPLTGQLWPKGKK